MSSNLNDLTIKKQAAKAIIDKIDELRAKNPYFFRRTAERNETIYEHDGFMLSTKICETEGGSLIEHFKLFGKVGDSYTRLFEAERASAKGYSRYSILPNIFIDPFKLWHGNATIPKFLDLAS